MQYITNLSEYQSDRESAVTFGKFDGLHRGHQKLVGKVQELSRENHVSSIVCAFDMHPLWREKEIQPQILMESYERYEHLEQMVDILLECPFTPEFSQVEAEDFIRDIIHGLFRARYVVVGTDFRFGCNKRGDVEMLDAYAKKFGYELFVIEKERYHDRIISSTYIKEVLRKGELDTVEKLLGYPYTVKGVVKHGNRLGRTLGFPTVNVVWPEEKVAPPNGVYFSRIHVEGHSYQAICNIGVKPTVSKNEKKLAESYLLGFDGDLYEKEIRIELLYFRRPEKKFGSLEDLKECIDRDLRAGKEFFGGK